MWTNKFILSCKLKACVIVQIAGRVPRTGAAGAGVVPGAGDARARRPPASRAPARAAGGAHLAIRARSAPRARARSLLRAHSRSPCSHDRFSNRL